MANIQNEKRPEKKARKRKEAQERQAAYDALTPQQKLDKLNRLAYRAQNERKKLRKILGEDEFDE